MPRAAPLLLLLLALAQRRACLPGPATAAPSGRDPCLSQPCRNNGTCSPVPARGPAAPRRLQLLPPQPPAAYSCACPAGVTGTYCQVRGAPRAPRVPLPGAAASARPSCPASLCPSVSLGVPARSALGPPHPTPSAGGSARSASPRTELFRCLFAGQAAPEARSGGGRCPLPRRAASILRAAAPARRQLALQPLVPLAAAAGGLGLPRASQGLAALRARGRVKRLPVRAPGVRRGGGEGARLEVNGDGAELSRCLSGSSQYYSQPPPPSSRSLFSIDLF